MDRFELSQSQEYGNSVSHYTTLSDDMTPTKEYSVVLATLYSRFDSDQMKGLMPEDGELPFFTIKVVFLPQNRLPIIDQALVFDVSCPLPGKLKTPKHNSESMRIGSDTLPAETYQYAQMDDVFIILTTKGVHL